MLEKVEIGGATLYCGDAQDVLDGLCLLDDLPSIDACVTDPPYGLSFMGKAWDYQVPAAAFWEAVLAAVKPGAHLLSFAGTRTQHRMAVNIEDAGFEIRDMVAWVYGSGFPKSLDVSKAIDKAAGAERAVAGPNLRAAQQTAKRSTSALGDFNGSSPVITAPATDAARQWNGWGTALKPALEPITVARKPLSGTVAANVTEYGTGALNIDVCRVGSEQRFNAAANKPGGNSYNMGVVGMPQDAEGRRCEGRWPANLIHDGSAEVVELFPTTKSGKQAKGGHVRNTDKTCNAYGKFEGQRCEGNVLYGDQGSAARFFYCAKASKTDRESGLQDAADRVLARSCQAQAQAKRGNTVVAESGAYNKARIRKNNHPTVKPTELMRYLCRLVTPPGGIVLDPFMGSGSTGKAAMLEGFRFIGIELDPDYFDIACRRIEAAHEQALLS